MLPFFWLDSPCFVILCAQARTRASSRRYERAHKRVHRGSCLGTGQRIGDVLRMRWNYIEAGGINVKQGKTGDALWVPMTPQLRAMLDATPKRGLASVARQDGRPLS